VRESAGVLDYPTAWAIQRRGGLDHHPRCSSVPGWDPISGPGFLCDCGAVVKEWKRLRASEALFLCRLALAFQRAQDAPVYRVNHRMMRLRAWGWWSEAQSMGVVLQ